MKTTLKLFFLLAGILFTSEVAKSDDFQWTGLGGNNSWTNAGNWENITPGGGSDADGIPDADDSVFFSSNATTSNGQARQITVLAGVELQISIGTITVFESITNNGTISFAGSGSTSNEVLNVSGDVMLVGTGEIILVELNDSFISNGGDGRLINESNTIRGTGTVDVDIVNQNLIRSELGRLALLESVDNNDGMIEVAEDSVLQGPVSGNATINGGSVIGETGTSTIEGAFSNVTFDGTVDIGLGDATFSESITNNGTISFAGSGSTSNEVLNVSGDVMLVGTGEIILVELNDSFISNGGDGRLINESNTIRGTGTVDVDIVNQNLIRSELGRLALLESVDNNDGMIEVAEDSVLQGPVSGNATINGGSVIGETGTSTIEGAFSNVTFDGTVDVGLGDATFSESITNNGTISFAGSGSTSNEVLNVSGDVMLVGTGEIILVELNDSFISNGGDGRLINESNTIRGTGTVDVDIVNQNLIRSELGRLALLESVDNNDGMIEVAEDSVLQGPVSGNATINGGSVIGETGTSTIEGAFSNVTFDGTVDVGLGDATFSESITNNGTISFAGSGSTSNEVLNVSGDVMLVGTGEIILVELNDSFISNGGDGRLINESNTIRGTGQINVPVTNTAGILLADSPNGSLVFNSGVLLPPVGESVLAVKVDGADFSQSGFLQFATSIFTNGTLEILAGNGFDAELGDVHTIISAGSIDVVGAGFEIEQAMAQSLTEGYEFEVVYDATTVSLMVSDIYLRGDVNTDGFLSLLDVSPFVDLLINGELQREADLNGDGSVNLLDVGPFVELLTGG